MEQREKSVKSYHIFTDSLTKQISGGLGTGLAARLLCLTLALVATVFAGSAQSLFDELVLDGETVSASTDTTRLEQPVEINRGRKAQRRNPRLEAEKTPSLWTMTDEYGNLLLDSLDFGPQELIPDPYMDVDDWMMPRSFFMPAVFINYDGTMALKVAEVDKPLAIEGFDVEKMNWADKAVIRDKRQQMRFQRFMIDHPELVPYHIDSMPRAPKEFVMEVDPTSAKIKVTELTQDVKEMKGVAKKVDLGRIHWFHTFDGSLQFSQAYISPNWYQGGKSNLNGILFLQYNIKLNEAFHKNLIFETNVQYKLGVNNAPDDEVHDYNISEDLFQVNTKFGLRAWKRWYYSITGQFKTQLLNNYKFNSEELKSAFLSPGELNVGVGMSYNYANKKGNVNFAANINPLSFNWKVCVNDEKLNPAWFGIEAGHRGIKQYGSNIELTFRWKLARNIDYNSRIWAFTNYEVTQGDWENTINFSINRYLSTKIYGHLRYQSDARRFEDTHWHKWQFKEILSIGFNYRFSRS